MKTPLDPSSGLRSAFDAALVLSVGMGFGRFAFTAIYPHMVEEGVVSLSGGSLAASANYAGYLLGAVLAIRAQARSAHLLCLWSFAGTAACLMAMAVLQSTWAIVALRALAGAISALSMVAASLWLLEQRGHMHRAPLMYAGVGIGIALSAELVVLGEFAGLRSHGLWLLLGVCGLLVGLAATPGLRSNPARTQSPRADAHANDAATGIVRMLPLVVIYGTAGFGYIITATYLPTLVKEALPDLDAAHVWAVFGLGAVPSCFLWHGLHSRLGTRRALTLNLGVQALGVGLPLLSASATGYLLSALLVGGTFMGTVTIAMPAAQRIARKLGVNLIAMMTVVYSIGQIAGPIVANALHGRTANFDSALLVAAASLAGAALLGAWAL